MGTVDAIKNGLGKAKRKPKFSYLNSGCTLLNMACTGTPNGGFALGTMVLLVGDSSSGKTWLTMTCLAEASIDERFDDYDLIFDDAENGCHMDIERYFGPEVKRRLIPPKGTKRQPIYSETVEDFYDNLDEAHERGKPFIYILDSMDVLSSSDEEKKQKEARTARKAGKEAAGSYGDGKAKKNSANLRRAVAKLRKTNSILIIITQTRDNIGFGAQFNPKTRSGGKVLKFYAHLEIWTEIIGQLTKSVMGKKRAQGITTRCSVKKNRSTGKNTRVEIPIYYSMGLDELGASIAYLVEEGIWKESKGVITAEHFDFKGKQEKLVTLIENEGYEKDLQMLVYDTWYAVEKASAVTRKSRYH